MKKVVVFVCSLCVILVSFPVVCFADEDIKTTIVNVWSESSATFNIKSSQIQTIIKDNNTGAYYFTVSNVSNKDTATIELIDGKYCLRNGNFYYSGDWSGSFWCKYSGSIISVLGKDYEPVYNDDGTKVVKWVTKHSSFYPLSSEYIFDMDSDNILKVSFKNIIASDLPTHYQQQSFYFYTALLPDPTECTVVQVGNYYSSSTFAYCFGQLTGDYDISQVNSKLDVIINSLGDLINIDTQLVPLVNAVNTINSKIDTVSDNILSLYDELVNIDLMLQYAISTIVDALYYEQGQTGDFVGLKTIYGLVTDFRADLNGYFSQLLSYFPASGDVFNGWRNFFSSFKELSFQNVMLQIQQQIDDAVNPLSDNNKPQFDEVTNSLKSDTAYGSFLDISSGMQNMFNGITGATPQASITVDTLPVSFFGANIPSSTINIDFSWYGKIRNEALYLWRFFIWAGYLFLLFKRAPDIIHGVGMVTDLTTAQDVTQGSSESILHSYTYDAYGDLISHNERHSYTAEDGTKYVSTIKHDKLT